MNNFVTRTLSAIVYAGLVIAAILVQPLCFGGHPLLFGVLFLIISTLAVREFHALLGSNVQIQSYAMICNALLFTTLYFLFYGDTIWRMLLLAYVAIMLLALITQASWMRLVWRNSRTAPAPPAVPAPACIPQTP